MKIINQNPEQKARDKIDNLLQNWIFKVHAGAGEKFNEEQMEWLRMICDHIISSFHFERDDLDMAPFDSKGGLGKMYQLFGECIDLIINEMNEAFVA